MIKNSLGKSGSIGEEISISVSTAITTGGDRLVGGITLPVGSWSVSSSLFPGAASGQKSSEAKLNVKGADGRNKPYDTYFQAIVDGVGQWASMICFPTRVVNIAQGDADKTVSVFVYPYGANTTATATIKATRLSF